MIGKLWRSYLRTNLLRIPYCHYVSGFDTENLGRNIQEFFEKAEADIKKAQVEAQLADLNKVNSADRIKTEKMMDSEKKHMRPKRIPYTLFHLLREPDLEVEKILRPHTGESFATMFRNSYLVELGSLKNKVVVGVVIENIDDRDLYIDFGAKFHAVCQVSPNDKTRYPRGSMVRIHLKDPEMASKFMLNTKAVSVREADAELIGPYVDSESGNSVVERGEVITKMPKHHWKLA